MKQIFKLSIIVVVAIHIAAQPSRPSAQNPTKKSLTARQIAQVVFPSVVVLMTEDSAGKRFSLGSGFFVRADAVVTNYHVIEGASRVFAKLIGQKTLYEVAGTIAIDKNADLALLKINGVRGLPVSLGDSNQAEIGDVIYVIGNPEGLEGTLSQGIVSALRRDYIQITAPISHGSSGSPVLNEEGQVIGVALGAIEDGQNLNFAIPSSNLVSLVQNATSVKSFPVEKRKHDPVSGEWLGTWTIYAIWDWEFGIYSQELDPSLKRPQSFSMNLQLSGQKVTGTYRSRDTNFSTAVNGSWADELLVLRYSSRSRDVETSSTISRLSLHVDGDRMSGEGIAIAPDDSRTKLKFKLDAVRKHRAN